MSWRRFPPSRRRHGSATGSFFHLITERDVDPKRSEPDGSTPLHHAAQADLLENLRQLEQAGTNLNDNIIVNAAIRKLDKAFILHLIDSAKKPLDENWGQAMPELEKIVWPGNPTGGMNPYGMGGMRMPGMGMMTDRSPSKSLSEEELANIRAIATLLLENSLTSAKLKTDDNANLTKGKLEKEREEAEEFSTVEDSDGDGFDDYDET